MDPQQAEARLNGLEKEFEELTNEIPTVQHSQFGGSKR